MRKIIAWVLVLSLCFGVTPVFSAQGGKRGASEKAYEHASDEAIFHRIGDWFATRGKSEEEKKAIVTERKAKRAAIRAQKEAEKQQRKAAQEAKKTRKKAQKKMKGMKKGFGK